jgi:peptidase M28-like protein
MVPGRASRSSRYLVTHLVIHPIVYLTVGLAAVCCATRALAQNHAQVERARLEPRAVIDQRLKSFATDNQVRESIIRKWFAESGCTKPNLSEESAQLNLPPNVICVLPGQTHEVIVVGAHTDKVLTAGDGVVDNWSGASLLPSLLFSLNAQKRHHTLRVRGFHGRRTGPDRF